MGVSIGHVSAQVGLDSVICTQQPLTALAQVSAPPPPPSTPCPHPQDLCGGNVMLTSSSSAAHGFTAKVGDFGLVRTAAAAEGKGQQQQLHPVEQRLANNAYG